MWRQGIILCRCSIRMIHQCYIISPYHVSDYATKWSSYWSDSFLSVCRGTTRESYTVLHILWKMHSSCPFHCNQSMSFVVVLIGVTEIILPSFLISVSNRSANFFRNKLFKICLKFYINVKQQYASFTMLFCSVAFIHSVKGTHNHII